MVDHEILNSGNLYDCDLEALEPALQEKLASNKELLFAFNQIGPSELTKRTEILKKLLRGTGERLYIEPPFHANWGCNTAVGEDFYANFNLTLVDDAEITIGDHVMIAPNVTITTAGHPIHPADRSQNLQFNKPIRIGNNVWIGAGAILLPGVSIGDGSVIGAGSVVTRDIPDHVVAVGVPCRVLRPITDADRAK